MAVGRQGMDPDLEFSLLSGNDKAAILMSSLGPETAQLIFQKLKDNDVKRMINTMAAVQKAPIYIVKKCLEEFYSQSY